MKRCLLGALVALFFFAPEMHAQTAGTFGTNTGPVMVNGQSCQPGGSCTIPSLTTSANSYVALGDSITCGYTLTDGSCPVGSTTTTPSPSAYPAIVSRTLGLPLTNLGVSGDQACDFFPHEVANGSTTNFKVASHQDGNPLYSIMVGTNDADVKGAGSYEADFKTCHQAVLAWLATPRENMVRAGDAGMTGTGSWTTTPNGTFLGGAGATAGSAGTLTATLTTYGSPIYVWYTVNDTFDSDCFTISVDGGTSTGPYCTGLEPHISTQDSTTLSEAFIRLPVAAGSHTIVASTSTGAVAILAFGTLPSQKFYGHPVILSGDVPNESTSNPVASTATIAAYNADVKADEALLVADGADIRHVPDQQYFLGAPSAMNDGLHPNASIGQPELAQAFLETAQASPSGALALATAQAAQATISGSQTYSVCSSSCTVAPGIQTVFLTGSATVTLPIPAGVSATVSQSVTVECYFSYCSTATIVAPSGWSEATTSAAGGASYVLQGGQAATFTSYSVSGTNNWILVGLAKEPTASAPASTGLVTRNYVQNQASSYTVPNTVGMVYSTVTSNITLPTPTASGTVATEVVLECYASYCGSLTVTPPSGWGLATTGGPSVSSMTIASGHSATFSSYSLSGTNNWILIGSN